MKKWLIITCLLILMIICSIVIGITITYYSNISHNEIDSNKEFAYNDNKLVDQDSLEVIKTSYSEFKVSPNATIVFEVYYNKCKHREVKEEKADTSLVNLNEQEIQEQYKEHGIATIYMDNSKTRLKREANVRPSVKMMDIIGLLYQAGYIDVPMGKLRRYIIKFWDDVPMDYDNMVTIQDFENIGRWFEDYFQLKPTRHVKTPCNDPCPVCGKTFEHKSHNHNELCPKCKQK